MKRKTVEKSPLKGMSIYRVSDRKVQYVQKLHMLPYICLENK